jgi:uncharacterized protein YkwD
VALVCSAVLSGQDRKAAPEFRATPLQRAMLDAHNAERLKAGKLPLALSARLVEAARIHAEDMAQREEMSHEGSDGSTPDERIRRTGYQPQTTGENVAMGHTTVEEAVDGWMDSEGHRRNILGDFREMGAARVIGDDDVAYWAVCFGKPFPELVADQERSAVVARVNAFREAAGKRAVGRSAILDRVAQALAESLAKDPEGALADQGKSVYKRVREEGYRYRAIRLRVGTGHADAEAFVEGMRTDAEDGQSVLGEFSDVGVGVAKSAEGVPSWVVLLARR